MKKHIQADLPTDVGGLLMPYRGKQIVAQFLDDQCPTTAGAGPSAANRYRKKLFGQIQRCDSIHLATVVLNFEEAIDELETSANHQDPEMAQQLSALRATFMSLLRRKT